MSQYRLLPDMTCQCCHLCYYLCYYLCTCTIEFGVKLPFRNTLIPLKFTGISILAIQVNRFSVSSLVEVYSNQFSLVISSFDSHSFIYSVYRSLQRSSPVERAIISKHKNEVRAVVSLSVILGIIIVIYNNVRRFRNR